MGANVGLEVDQVPPCRTDRTCDVVVFHVHVEGVEYQADGVFVGTGSAMDNSGTDIVIEKLRGIKGLLTINTEVVKQLYEAGLPASAGWFVAKQAYTVSVDKDLSHVADILETTEEPPKVETLFTFD